MKNTEKWPVPVNVGQVADDQYLVNILLNKNQLEDLGGIAGEFRNKRAGQYNSTVVSINEAIHRFLEEE